MSTPASFRLVSPGRFHVVSSADRRHRAPAVEPLRGCRGHLPEARLVSVRDAPLMSPISPGALRAFGNVVAAH
jgi:hypothetical protein